ncbi:MAG: UbiA-like polyprenyltransferase [bacterium]|nr:UbiA-like polyprenyltransferase [bacterium]
MIIYLIIMKQIRVILELIKFQHTIFALPFALISMLVCANGLPQFKVIFWILVAMVSARSSAMAFNRVVDLRFDALNPRTQNRPLVLGKISVKSVWLFMVTTAIIFIISAYMLNNLAFYLSPLALAILYFYSFTKRFTWLTHIFLGLSLAIAPIGVWIAINPQIAVLPLILGLAVLFWVAGFDIIYATLDFEFDETHRLHSMVVNFGIPKALLISRVMHLFMVVLLLWFGVLAQLGLFFFIGVFIVALMLIYEHSLVKPTDLSKVNIAFFNINGLVSIFLFVMTWIDKVLIREIMH